MVLLSFFRLSIRLSFSSGNILLGSPCCRATTTVGAKKNEVRGGVGALLVSARPAAGGQELPPALSIPRDPRPVQEAAMGWGWRRGPYQQQVLHLVLGFIASRGIHLKRKGKGAV